MLLRWLLRWVRLLVGTCPVWCAPLLELLVLLLLRGMRTGLCCWYCCDLLLVCYGHMTFCWHIHLL